MLRNYDEGLILSERQDEIPLGIPRLARLDEVDHQVQLNLRDLLQRQASQSSVPPRWVALPQWIQASLEEDERSSIRPQTQEFYDGLIAVDGEQSPDPGHVATPTREPSIPEDEREMQANLLSLLHPLEARQERRSPSLTSIPPTSASLDKSSLPQVTCNFGLMRRTGVRDRKLEFDTAVFSNANASLFTRRLQAQASKSIGLMFLLVF
jgi:hypothetical protein